MSTFWLILLVIFAWLLQNGLSIMQVRHSSREIKHLVAQYRGMDGFYLFSGTSRKVWGSGAMVLVVVDKHYEVRKCLVLSGYTVFSKFKRLEKYEGKHVGEMLYDAHEIITQTRRISMKQKALALAFQMAAENALLTISSKRRTCTPNSTIVQHG
ncbi:transcriptional regulator GutM [Ammoniphilus sp. 3BR4]|uniref:transcriptional regulator GutM n=1 Tax=Ammoniphilus sp. 3BR4 TaxID=3158265 RepID=UPI0034657412